VRAWTGPAWCLLVGWIERRGMGCGKYRLSPGVGSMA
jgi:hypothetical protein